jgi:hypothetical protein
MKRTGGIVLIVVVAVAIAYAWLRPRAEKYPDAYIGERTAIVWNSLAAVRQAVATLHFGDKVGVVDRRSDQVRVQLAGGHMGWLDARVLMDAALWERSAKLLEATRKMPVQATGRTKVATNVRVEAGRTAPRLFQFGRDVPVQVFGRASAEWSPSGEEGNSREANGEESKPKREDWFLVRGRAPMGAGNRASASEGAQAGSTEAAAGTVEVAGWVVARFIEFDLPDTVKDYTSSSGMRVLAWFELNRVPEQPGSAAEKPQYLVAGARGVKNYGCDFNMLRVYTWGAARHRYETAYVEGGMCGLLPVRVGRSSSGDPEFRFQSQRSGAKEERVYRMRQTSVRRVREVNERPSRKRK